MADKPSQPLFTDLMIVLEFKINCVGNLIAEAGEDVWRCYCASTRVWSQGSPLASAAGLTL